MVEHGTLQPCTTVPAQLKITRIFFTASSANQDACFNRRIIVIFCHRPPPLKIAVINNPYLWISMGKGNFSQTTLGIFIKQPRSYPCMS